MSINKVFITGNLTRDPEARTIASGAQIMAFSVAVNDRRRDPSTGEWSDYANYVDCTMFGNSQNNRINWLSQNIAKGTKVAIEGKLRWSQWEAKDGSGKRSKIEVIVDDIELMSKTEQTTQAQPAAQVPTYQPPTYQPAATQRSAQAPQYSVYDEDIPF